MAASQVDYYAEDQAAVDEQSSPQLQVRLGRCELATVAQHKMTMSTCTYSLPQISPPTFNKPEYLDLQQKNV